MSQRMKRCPQCEFIYDDEQGLCDMDGCELVYDQRALVVTDGVSPRGGLVQVRRRTRRGSRRMSLWMSLAVLPVGGVTLGAALFLISNVRTQPTPAQARRATTQDAAPPSSAAPPPAEAVARQTPAPEHAPAPPEVADDAADAPSVPRARPTIIRAGAKSRAPAPARTAIPRREEKRPKPEGERAKKESKLGSILKKTGRALKKPFGF